MQPSSMANKIFITCNPNIGHYIDDNLRSFYLSIGVLCIIIAIVGALINTLVLKTIFSLKMFKSVDEKLRIVMLATDFLAAIFAALTNGVMFTLLFSTQKYGKIICELSNVAYISGISLQFLSLSTITLIHVQLYIAVVKPYFYSSLLNIRILSLILLTLWVTVPISTTLFFALSCQRYWDVFKVFLSLYFFISYVAVCTVYIRVNKELKILQKKTCVVANGIQQDFNALKNTKKLAFIVLLAYTFCYGPFVVFAITEVFWSFPTHTRTYFVRLFVSISFLKTILNPMIYCIRLKRIRRTLFCSTNKIGVLATSRQSINVLTAVKRSL